jgi:uncharacterized protein (TIGR01777 family)
MHIVIAGASGFLGTRLTQELRSRGHHVTGLTRRPDPGPDERTWNPYAGVVDQGLVDEADVVVNLAGSRLFGIPQTQKWQRALHESRVETTRVLAEAIARADRPPAFLANNATAYYGDHGEEVVTEASDSRGDAFMTQVARDWQAAADAAVAAGSRVCILRTAPVLARGGDTMGILTPLFRLGLGTRLGDGTQRFPVVSMRDFVGSATMLAEHPTAQGPFNLCCPETPTNAEFTAAFARTVHRPAFLAVPRRLLALGAGPAAPELLRSMNLRPAALLDLGYRFEDPDASAVMASALS